MENNLKQKGIIYCLVNPITEEIFYVGATKTGLLERLKKHYWDLTSYQNDKRQFNKRFEYLENLLPDTASIGLIEEVELNELSEKEKYWISYYKNLNPNLTNTTIGGKGGDTYSLQSDDRQKEISQKISEANKGKSKPDGFAENLSKARQGINNPAAKEISIGWIVCDKQYLFKYGFEINSFMGSNNSFGNIFKALRKNGKATSNSRNFELYSNLTKEMQDIVHNNYESSY